jgi:methylphosphotriester-DNA--protein-cysteine methyltransferase
MAPKDEQAYWEANFWEALETRDTHMDGVFFFAVITTGVYCRPSCPSRRPRRENVIFFQRRDAAERAGFRACLRCKPERDARAMPSRRWSKRSAVTWSGIWTKPSRWTDSAAS